MRTEIRTISPTVRELRISLTDEELEEYRIRRLQKLARRIKIRGFRPGKAPLHLVRQQVDPEELEREAREELLAEVLQRELEGGQLRGALFLEEPIWEDSGAEVQVRLRVQVVPELPEIQYRNLVLRIPELPAITDQNVRHALEDLRERNADLKAVERPARVGDFLAIEDAESGRLRLAEVTEESGLQEKTVGEQVEAEVWTRHGKETVKGPVKQVLELRRPELVELAKRLGLENEEKLREAVRRQLEEEREEKQKELLEQELREHLLAQVGDLEVPAGLLENEKRRLARNLRQRYRTQQEWEEAIQKEFGSREKYEEVLQREALRHVRYDLVLDWIAEKEDIRVLPEDEDEEVRRIAQLEGRPVKQVRADITRKGLWDTLRDEIRRRKTREFLVKQVKVEYEKA